MLTSFLSSARAIVVARCYSRVECTSSDFFIKQMCLLDRVFVFTREENWSECDVACEQYRIDNILVFSRHTGCPKGAHTSIMLSVGKYGLYLVCRKKCRLTPTQTIGFIVYSQRMEVKLPAEKWGK